MANRGVRVAILAVVGALTIPAFAIAAGAEHHHASPWDLRFHLLNFLLYVGIMYALLNRPFRAAMAKRREVIQERVASAGKELTAAESAMSQLRSKMGQVDRDAAQIAAEILADGQREADRIVADAEKKAQRVKDQAKRLAQAEVKGTEVALRRELARLVLARAEERVRAELTAERDEAIRERATRVSKELFQ